jgi:hypothetical protein
MIVVIGDLIRLRNRRWRVWVVRGFEGNYVRLGGVLPDDKTNVLVWRPMIEFPHGDWVRVEDGEQAPAPTAACPCP